jgi:hypothetical protein
MRNANLHKNKRLELLLDAGNALGLGFVYRMFAYKNNSFREQTRRF